MTARPARRTFMRFVVLAAALALLLAPAAPLRASEAIEAIGGYPVVARQALVRFRAVKLDSARAASLKASLDADQIAGVGGTGVFKIRSRSKSAATLVQRLSARVDVLYVEPDYIVHTTADPNDTYYSQLWGMKNT